MHDSLHQHSFCSGWVLDTVILRPHSAFHPNWTVCRQLINKARLSSSNAIAGKVLLTASEVADKHKCITSIQLCKVGGRCMSTESSHVSLRRGGYALQPRMPYSRSDGCRCIPARCLNVIGWRSPCLVCPHNVCRHGTIFSIIVEHHSADHPQQCW